MAQINYGDRTISCKIVYYGPGVSGKTTNLQEIFANSPNDNKGKMVSLATEGDRTLYFDFLPLDLGEIKGFKTKFQLYTVPGQVYYNATRKLVLRGVDAVIFVADSQKSKMEENKESLQNLYDNLKEMNIELVKDIPFVIQYNKRDLPDIESVETLRKELNTMGVPDFEAIAFKGVGVFKTLKAAAKLFITSFHQNYGFDVEINDVDDDNEEEIVQSSNSEIKKEENVALDNGIENSDNVHVEHDEEITIDFEDNSPQEEKIDLDTNEEPQVVLNDTEEIELDLNNESIDLSLDEQEEELQLESHSLSNNNDSNEDEISLDLENDDISLDLEDNSVDNSINENHESEVDLDLESSDNNTFIDLDVDDELSKDIKRLKEDSTLDDNKSNENKESDESNKKADLDEKTKVVEEKLRSSVSKKSVVKKSKSGTVMFVTKKKQKKSFLGSIKGIFGKGDK